MVKSTLCLPIRSHSIKMDYGINVHMVVHWYDIGFFIFDLRLQFLLKILMMY